MPNTLDLELQEWDVAGRPQPQCVDTDGQHLPSVVSQLRPPMNILL